MSTELRARRTRQETGGRRELKMGSWSPGKSAKEPASGEALGESGCEKRTRLGWHGQYWFGDERLVKGTEVKDEAPGQTRDTRKIRVALAACSPAEVQQRPGRGRSALCRPAEEVKLSERARLLGLHVLKVEAPHQEVLAPDVL